MQVTFSPQFNARTFHKPAFGSDSSSALDAPPASGIGLDGSSGGGGRGRARGRAGDSDSALADVDGSGSRPDMEGPLEELARLRAEREERRARKAEKKEQKALYGPKINWSDPRNPAALSKDAANFTKRATQVREVMNDLGLLVRDKLHEPKAKLIIKVGEIKTLLADEATKLDQMAASTELQRSRVLHTQAQLAHVRKPDSRRAERKEEKAEGKVANAQTALETAAPRRAGVKTVAREFKAAKREIKNVPDDLNRRQRREAVAERRTEFVNNRDRANQLRTSQLLGPRKKKWLGLF